jgi:hypothetical protein
VGDENTRGGFWSSITGVLTAIAGLITAVAALVGAFVAAGIVGPSSTPSASSPPATASHASERPRLPAVELETSPSALNTIKNQMNRKNEVAPDELLPSKMK